MLKSTTKFSDRVDDYVKYRPAYPLEIISILRERIGLPSTSVIADMGAGTGISTSLFINNENTIYAVEPNKEMREAAEIRYGNKENFFSIDGSAEHTSLKDNSVDIIFCAQAFHWFDQAKVKIEWNRILKANGHIVLVWNVRSITTDFQKEYESILKTIPGYNDAAHRNIEDAEIINFFSPNTMHKECLDNFQTLDIDGVKGRLRSSSYFPKKGTESEVIMQQLEKIFLKYEKNNCIAFDYSTNIYWF